MVYKKLKFSISEGIARIVLADTANHNAVDLAVTQELRAAATECEVAKDLRCVLLTALGAGFSVGGNLREFINERDHIQAHVREMTIDFHAAILTLNRLAVPVVCAVNGLAAGGGASLVCMSDLAIATRSAKFNFAYTRSGLTPDGGATFFLPRLVGPQRAFDILATNPTLTADEALGLGLIARVVDDANFVSAVETLISQLAAMPSRSVGALKRLLRQGMENTLAEQLDAEGRSISHLAATPTTMATMEAFFEKAKR